MTPQRIQLSRRKGWRIPPNTVKVDRATPYGNPIEIGGTMRVEADGSMYDAKITAPIAVELFREYIAGALRTKPRLLDPLRGKNLACWCVLGAPCHAEVLLELANK